MPHAEIGSFMGALRARDGIAARALEFTILTAARTNETLGTTRDEVDVIRGMWTLPPHRRKAGKEHRVPLCGRAVEIIKEMADIRVGDLVFPGMKDGAALSNMAMLAVLARLNRAQWTVHGFRSTFKNWATDWSPTPAEIIEAAKRGEIVEAFPRDLVEVALAHSLDSKTEEAYRHTDMIEKRRRLMTKWGERCGRALDEGNVIWLRAEERQDG